MSNTQASLINLLGRMVALSNRFGAEGQINLHKLMEAIVYAETRRLSAPYEDRMTADSMRSELASVVEDLRANPPGQEVMAALDRGQQALGGDRLPLIEDIPDPFVCRACGHAALGEAPARCPGCGAWPARFRRFVGTFNVDAPDPFATLAVLAQTPGIVDSLIADLSEELLAREPVPGEWSIRRLIQHFADAQGVLLQRLELMLSQDGPELASEAVFAWDHDAGTQVSSTQELLADYAEIRGGLIDRLESLSLRDWWRTGYHTEFGTVTILHQASYFAYHEAFHYPDFVEKRRQLTSGRDDL